MRALRQGCRLCLCLLACASCTSGPSPRDATPVDVPQALDAGHVTDTGTSEISIPCSMPGERCTVSEDCCGGPPYALCLDRTCFMTELP
jgi:hypothetical protein